MTVNGIEFSKGNLKIGKDTVIINITSATHCISKALGLCHIPRNKCYALRAEVFRPSCLEYRERQARIWNKTSAEKIAKAVLIHVHHAEKNKVHYLRFSEAGDFKNQKDVTKMSKIADLLEPEHVIVYGYTARSDLDFTKISRNMIVNGSGFMLHNNFKAVASLKNINGKICPGNCRICNMCKEKKYRTIYIKYH